MDREVRVNGAALRQEMASTRVIIVGHVESHAGQTVYLKATDDVEVTVELNPTVQLPMDGTEWIEVHGILNASKIVEANRVVPITSSVASDVVNDLVALQHKYAEIF